MGIGSLPGATIICEQATGEALEVPPPFHLIDERTYGTTQLKFLALDS